MNIPNTQFAVQLVGPGRLTLNESKPVHRPGPHQILAKTEAVGLCFSDLKLLKQFDQHVRKGEVVSGIDPGVLAEIPSYVPGSQPTVPGHEVVCRIVEVGEQVRHYRVGERWLIQADYRALKTAGSNGAFGYNFEGGLQEYVLLDERVVGAPGEANEYMLQADDSRCASQLALVEPWACVENSYITPERRGPKPGGVRLEWTDGDASSIPDESVDDLVYRGSDPAELALLGPKLAKGGIMVVAPARPFETKVDVGVGRIHYGGTRWVGSYDDIPANGEVRPGDRALVMGAGGPMGQMHVLRLLAAGAGEVVASDVDPVRLAGLTAKVPAGSSYRAVLATELGDEAFDYIAIMAPLPALVDEAIHRARPRGIVNVFAGIPAPVIHPIDLDALVAKHLFVFGTSGSELGDMKRVLEHVLAGRIDTNASVAAVSGMAGATAGLAAVENRTLDGKIIVYPSVHETGLIPLARLAEAFPTVAAKLQNGKWTPEAEAEFLAVAK